MDTEVESVMASSEDQREEELQVNVPIPNAYQNPISFLLVQWNLFKLETLKTGENMQFRGVSDVLRFYP